MRKTLLRLGAAVYVAFVMALVSVAVRGRVATTEREARSARDADMTDRQNVPAALARKLGKMAQTARFAPLVVSDSLDIPESYAAQDWLEHSIDGAGNSPPSFTAFATARNDWFGL